LLKLTGFNQVASAFELKSAAEAVLSRSPAQPVFRWRAARRLVVLAYHSVGDAERFSSHVRYLRSKMHPVSMDEVAASIQSGSRLPPRAVLVTFDDGGRSVYDTALPILREHDVPALAFLVAGVIGTSRPFWWHEVEELVRRGGRATHLPTGDPAGCVRKLKLVADEVRLDRIEELRTTAAGPPVLDPQLTPSEVRELDATGVSVGNHTATHPCLDRCSSEKVESELVSAHERLTEIAGRAPTAFAFPNGSADERATPILRSLGYEAAFLFDHRIAGCPPADRYRISRLRISSDAGTDRLRIVMSGLHSAVHHLVGRE
jgi:peptidoglycan/xylan/chitin deacetylase (PgdA/CDA1 family)